MKRLIFTCLTIMVIAGCANSGNKSVEDATPESVDAVLKVGETTKQEVEAIFGPLRLHTQTVGY